MKQPKPVVVSLLIAFGIVAAIEFRTLLAMLGFEPAARLYYLSIGILITAIIVALFVFGNDESAETASRGNSSVSPREQ